MTTPIKALRIAAVASKVGLSKSTIFRKIKAGQFPTPAKLSERVTVWNETELDEWLAKHFAKA